VLNRQFVESLPRIEATKPSVLALWFFPTQAKLKPITKYEAEWADQLPIERSRQYQHARGYVRNALSEIWEVPALEIPLNAPPGKSPELLDGWGNISFSHCCDGLFIGWSPSRIGVDIERTDRAFQADRLTKRFFSKAEKEALSHLSGEDLRSAVLKQWVVKEAAIKWQRGKLAVDISQWSLCKKSNQAIHQSLGHEVGMHSFCYKSWYMAVAFDSHIHDYPPIICSYWI